MRKVHIHIAVVALAAILVSSAAWAGSVVGSAHDLSTRLGTGEVCLSCHAPHSAPNAAAGPIWNHALSTQSFTRKGKSITFYSNSALCMGCHDGVTAVGNFNVANPNITVNDTTSPIQSLSGSKQVNGVFVNNLGIDLSATHPVSVVYRNLTATDSTSFHAAVASVSSSGTTSYKIGGTLSLEQGATTGTRDTVGCSTCHNPHDPTNYPFLRVNNAGSALCLTCHIH